MKPELVTWLKLVRAAYLTVFPPPRFPPLLISSHSLTLKKKNQVNL